MVRFQGLRKIVNDADGRFQEPNPITRLADYSVIVIARPNTRAAVRVPAAEKSANRVTIPDITLLPVEK